MSLWPSAAFVTFSWLWLTADFYGPPIFNLKTVYTDLME